MPQTKALLFLLVLSLVPGACFAQVEMEEVEVYERYQQVSIMGGLFVDGTEHANLTGAFLFTARKHLGLEFEATTSFMPNGTISTFSSNLFLPFPTASGRFNGYVIGGVGVTRSHIDLGDKEDILIREGVDVDPDAWDFTFDLGLGGEVMMTENLYWRFDYRAFLLTLNEGNDTDHYHRFVMGIGGRF